MHRTGRKGLPLAAIALAIVRGLRGEIPWIGRVRTAAAVASVVPFALAVSPRELAEGVFILSLTATWCASLFAGVKWSTFSPVLRGERAHPFARPSWTRAAWAGCTSTLVLSVLVGPRDQTASIVIAIGFSLNLAYLGAKIGCAALGCCGRRRSSRSVAPLVPRRISSLQRTEVRTTAAYVVLGAVLLHTPLTWLTPWFLVAGHGILRGYAGYLRFPHRSASSFVTDVGSGGFVLLGTAMSTLARWGA